MNKSQAQTTNMSQADKKTCGELQHLFHMAMELSFIHTLNNCEAMMDYLNKRGDPDWTADYIWSLANSNKIDWVHDYGDPTEYETYKAEMNQALAEYVRLE